MKKLIILIIVAGLALTIQAQDITNTLGSSGSFIINEDNNGRLMSVKEGNSSKPLVRIGTSTATANSTLQIEGSFSPVVKILQDSDFSGNAYSASDNDYSLIIWNNVSSAVTINLPSPNTIYGRVYIIKNNSNHNVSVDAGSGNTIDASQTVSLTTTYNYIVIQAASSGYWAIIGGN